MTTRIMLNRMGLRVSDLGHGYIIPGYGEQFHLLYGLNDIDAESRIFVISKDRDLMLYLGELAGRMRSSDEALSPEEEESREGVKEHTEALIEFMINTGVPECCAKSNASKFFDYGNDLFPVIVSDTIGSDKVEEKMEIEVPHVLNQTLLSAGVYAIPYWPCSYGCAMSLENANKNVDFMRSIDTIMAEYLLEMLSMPAEYSLLHGIAQIITPIVRLTYSSLPSYYKTSIDVYISDPVLQYHEIVGAASGVRHPFKTRREVNLDALNSKKGC